MIMYLQNGWRTKCKKMRKPTDFASEETPPNHSPHSQDPFLSGPTPPLSCQSSLKKDQNPCHREPGELVNMGVGKNGLGAISVYEIHGILGSIRRESSTISLTRQNRKYLEKRRSSQSIKESTSFALSVQ